MQQYINLAEISLREIEHTDIPLLIDYWYHNDSAFFESLGLDMHKFPAKDAFKAHMENICTLADKPALIIQNHYVPIGYHILTRLVKGESALIHGHLWDEHYRGLGIMSYIYPSACQLLFKRFQLKKLIFKVSADNIASIRVKYKMGAKYIGQESVGHSVFKSDKLIKIFELQNFN